MKKCWSIVLTLALLASLIACQPQATAPTWQEQYDLGVRYLSEGNYEEAIIAFTAAIEIDPMRAEAYSGLADVYLSMGEYGKAVALWEQAKAGVTDEKLLAYFDEQGLQYQSAQSFLNSGETGVQIIECSFDKETYLSGAETTFRLTVAYRCPEGVVCSMTAGANTESPWSFKRFTEKESLAGSGIYQLSGTVTPVQWDNGRYFGLYVSLSKQPGGEWIGDHAWYYITPEGEYSDFDAPRNAHGGTLFTARYNYRSFEEFSPEEQQFIQTVGSAVMAGDTETVKAALGFEMENNDAYTIWGNYKLHIYSSGEDLTDDGDRSVSLEIELRPENGIGYYYRIHCIDAVATLVEESWSDAVFIYSVTAPCVDWCWQGEVTIRDLFYHYQTWDIDGSTCNSADETTITGTMVDGLREGAFQSERHEVQVWSKWNDHNRDEWTTSVSVYSGGKLLEEDGEKATEETWYSIYDFGWGAGAQWRFDALCW